MYPASLMVKRDERRMLRRQGVEFCAEVGQCVGVGIIPAEQDDAAGVQIL
jgi:hypothetical protein